MNNKEIKKHGGLLGIKSALIGLLITYIFIASFISITDTFLNAILWINEFEFLGELVISVFGLIISGYFFGQFAAWDILIKKKNSTWTGVKYGFLILWTATIIGSITALFLKKLESIESVQVVPTSIYNNTFIDYFLEPFYYVTVVGFIPMLFIGRWFGNQIRKSIFELEDASR